MFGVEGSPQVTLVPEETGLVPDLLGNVTFLSVSRLVYASLGG